MILKKTLLLIFLTVIGVSCQSSHNIVKRKYNKGYYAHSFRAPKSTTKSECEKSKTAVIPKKKENAKSNSDLNNPLLEGSLKSEVINDFQLNASASTEKVIFLLEKHNYNFFPDSCGDTIILKSGTKIIAKIIEIANEEIKYKRCDDSDSPIWTMAESEMSKIIYLDETKNFQNSNKQIKKAVKSIDVSESSAAAVMAIFALVFFIGVVAGIIIESVGLVVVSFLFISLFCLLAYSYGKNVIERGTAPRKSAELRKAYFGFGVGLAYILGMLAFILILIIALKFQ